MDPSLPTLLVFHGDGGDGVAERLVAGARVAAARHSVEQALAAGFGAAIVATDVPAAFAGPGSGVLVDPDPPGPFNFGDRLRELVARFGLERPALMGSGALPLLGHDDFATVASTLIGPDAACVTNNLFSGDLTGWTPGHLVERVGPLTRDNLLPRRLRDLAGLSPVVLGRTTATTFDLDTPADLTVLALQEMLPRPLREALNEVSLPLARYRAVLRTLCDPKAELAVAGRVSSSAWQYLETETACRVRLLSEERGLAAAGPGHRARSALGFLLEAVGIEGFFARIAELGDAIVIDTRVIEAHLGREPSREDRFQSDLFNAEAIRDPFLREFTAAAAGCMKPVLLGGHSLVSGGLMAMTDVAWRENDRRLGLA